MMALSLLGQTAEEGLQGIVLSGFYPEVRGTRQCTMILGLGGHPDGVVFPRRGSRVTAGAVSPE